MHPRDPSDIAGGVGGGDKVQWNVSEVINSQEGRLKTAAIFQLAKALNNEV
jgi:hypothetical protein